MAKPGPALAVNCLHKVLTVASPPRPARDVLVEIAVVETWFGSLAEAQEAAERWEKAFLTRLRDNLGERNRLGRFCLHDFNSSSDYMVQGCAFIEVGVDPPDVQEAKMRRGAFAEYVSAIQGVTCDDFETVCRGILAELGVDDPEVTRHSADEGIDFYGRLQLEGNLKRVGALPGIYRRLAVWMVGQAKHYDAVQGGTPDIRAVVGAVDLARAKAFGSANDQYPDLDIRACDPVFYFLHDRLDQRQRLALAGDQRRHRDGRGDGRSVPSRPRRGMERRRFRPRCVRDLGSAVPSVDEKAR